MQKKYQLGQHRNHYENRKFMDENSQNFYQDQLTKSDAIRNYQHLSTTNYDTKYDNLLSTKTGTTPKYSKQNDWENNLKAKLNALKQQFRDVPNWEGYAHNILFENNQNITKYDQPQNSHKYKNRYPFKTPQNPYNRSISHKNIEKKSIAEQSLIDSNISFKIKETSSIQQSIRKKPHLVIQSIHNHNYYNKNKITSQQQPPINQFQLFSASKIQPKKHGISSHNLHSKNNRVDQRIQMIEKKIRQCQQKKKRLNLDVPMRPQKSKIEFNQPDKKLAIQRSGSYTKIYNKKQEQQKCVQYPSQKYRKSSKPPKYPIKRQNSNRSVDQIMYNCPVDNNYDVSPKFAGQQKSSYFMANKSLIKQNPQTKPIFQESQSLQFTKSHHQQFTYKTMKRSIEDWNKNTRKGIQNRRKIRSNYQISPISERKQIKKFVQKLSHQSKLDEQFRNNKLWLKSSKQDKKYEILQKMLIKQDIRLSLDETTKLFQLSQEQDNPFFSVNSFNSDFNQVVKSFIDSQDYWALNIEHKFDNDKLKHQGFNRFTIDMDKKNSITLQDFVRFLNMETGTFFRNRDLVTIFKRLTISNKITYEELLKIICY